jgi:hypothetical protein
VQNKEYVTVKTVSFEKKNELAKRKATKFVS